MAKQILDSLLSVKRPPKGQQSVGDNMDANTSLERRFDFVGMKVEFDPRDRLSMDSWFSLSHQVVFQPLKAGDELQSHRSCSDTIYFLTEGVAREFSPRGDGIDVNRAFHRPYAVIGSLDSYNQHKNNSGTIQMVTDGEAFAISCAKLWAIMREQHDLRTWYRLAMCRNGAQMQTRLANLLSKNESQRLQEFAEESPDLVRAVPTQHLSNYLDVPSVVVNLVKKRVSLEREIA